jgi:hypothetical protein
MLILKIRGRLHHYAQRAESFVPQFLRGWR